MYDKLIILSDIHANLSALDAVVKDIEWRGLRPDGIVLLGDLINYGMRPNETITALGGFPWPLLVNIFGNHEKSLTDGDSSRFSTDRGRRMLSYTADILSGDSRDFIGKMNREGFETKLWQGKKVLFVHGSVSDPFWGRIGADVVSDETYSRYDIVVSGHSHIPHLMEQFYPAENSAMRNKKRTLFINPGSVGQPRNHNPRAQYVYMELSSETVSFNAVTYDVATEQRFFPAFLDDFYKQRLSLGI